MIIKRIIYLQTFVYFFFFKYLTYIEYKYKKQNQCPSVINVSLVAVSRYDAEIIKAPTKKIHGRKKVKSFNIVARIDFALREICQQRFAFTWKNRHRTYYRFF
jgi:hypothetical protein